MCGIAGCLGRIEEERVSVMIRSLAHRGPDSNGLLSIASPAATLGHTRLSILDVSAAGQQPMQDPTARLTIVYNGEVYNFRELRAALERVGYTFRSRTDTEVLLAGYAHWGTELPKHLEGMFAFAIVDSRPPAGWPQAFLVRDRLGIKPLLYLDSRVGFWFSSELTPFLTAGISNRRLDHTALGQFLAFGSAFQPATLLEDVRALPPGHQLEISNGRVLSRRYWDLHEATSSKREDFRRASRAELLGSVRDQLGDAVTKHLLADVPVGAFLSGGVDSGIVVGLMSRAAPLPIRTFCVGFDRDSAPTDERQEAAAFARRFGTDHSEVVTTASDVVGLLDSCVRATDQPSADGANVWLVSRAAAKAVKVALTGLGGDEVFAGYGHFRWLGSRPGFLDSSPGLSWLLGRLTGLRRLGPTWIRGWATSLPDALCAFRRIFPAGASGAAYRDWIAPLVSSPSGSSYASLVPVDGDPIQQVSYLEVNRYLLSTLLRDADAMSMAHSLELRPVLLHHPLVELVYALPYDLKVRYLRLKYALLRASGDLLPLRARWRRKRGFSLPAVNWLDGPLRQQFRDLLTTTAARELFTAGHLDRLHEPMFVRRCGLASWSWAMLLGWLQHHRLSL